MRRSVCIASAFAALFLAYGCSARGPILAGEAPFVHVVLFKVKAEPKDAAVAQLVDDIRTVLAPLPTVKGLWVGAPAPTATRPIVDANYDVGLMLLFEDQQGLQAYLDHPAHAEFAKRHDTGNEVRVFDFTR
ncbi:MAG TPA: Dabb family protein [Planctomycetota bacterium]|jgi:hypothetical protein|nr:Dabb family protein [Planctomycetota bacterium]OQC21873.1 MAG: Stress responsive A/B Barrel Domain protein [Planctomycetes bacterium ADurb.Bin069]NMD35682.1 Dabb family protein [Planctomycetota bacterium]HNR98176.1 Dabb family protein [Planctomycetota bacterium]HNU24955.1 Dabb family protein [Planctomycetota bacterium]